LLKCGVCKAVVAAMGLTVFVVWRVSPPLVFNVVTVAVWPCGCGREN